MTHTTLEALTQLRRVLLKVQADELPFDITIWDCGTAACAIGYACRDPWFASRGLELKLNASGLLVPTYREEYGFKSVRDFFAFQQQEFIAEHLFEAESYDDEYAEVGEVLERVEDVLERVKGEIASLS